MRTCEDDVDMSKCEGYCVSTTTPSAMDRKHILKAKVLWTNLLLGLASVKIVNAAERAATKREQSL